MENPQSIRAFARHLGVSEAAVRKAISAGRISNDVLVSVRRGNRTQTLINDPERAAEQWAENSGRFRALRLVYGDSTSAEERQRVREKIRGAALKGLVNREQHQAMRAELEYRVRCGELIPTEKIEAALQSLVLKSADWPEDVRRDVLDAIAAVRADLEQDTKLRTY